MCWSTPRGKEEQLRASPTVSKVWASDPPRRRREGPDKHLQPLARRLPALVPWTLSPPIRRLGPAFKESCGFHQEVERSAPKEPWTLPSSISQGPALLGTQCGTGSSAPSPLPHLPQWVYPSQVHFFLSFLATQTDCTVELCFNWILA